MQDDDRSFFDREFAVARDMTGADPTPDEFARQFAKYDLTARALKIDQMNADMQSRSFSIDQTAKILPYERAMRNMHAALRKIGK